MPRKIGSLTLYSIDDLHEMLGISKMTLRAYLREGRLKGRKLGVSWFVTENAIREYFEEEEAPSTVSKKKKSFRYIVQGVNDLVSETEYCETIQDVIQTLNEQAIISLFQVQKIDGETEEIVEIIKARDFLDKHDSN
ncbi:MAG: helix-turn-helix domain-containing protein [Balneola sp.]|nr:helix-turn-helix domain-containing protein [Balneola sp.]MBO6652073.1 helix-turn-helix domain-containing protein [Balneola sp.]MBO6712478.1 helix-turn-helix domain-containing protein [Balneola sp.]MBO6801029.1 helix-turn-helix domain-containing protein [Balneola sp.]MBO6870701.1 helix-turn-helix domain-containing protein [Balneola sp.]